MPFSVGRRARLEISGRTLSRRVREMPHGLQEDLFQRVSSMRKLPHQKLLPIHEAPNRVDLDAWRQHDAPAAETFGHALGANLRQCRAEVVIVAGDLELDEGT